MQRPYVQVQSSNQLDTLQQHLESILPRLKALPGVVGITLNGGMSRGYADHLSEIDITLYLNPETYQIWQRGRSPVQMMQKSFYDLLALLVEKQTMTLNDWQEKATLEILNRDPFYGLVTIEGDQITLDRDKLLSLKPEAMYSWHDEIVRAVRREIT